MKALFYRALASASKIFGLWIFSLFAWIISTGYFFFFPLRVRISLRFYRALFPNKGFSAHIRHTWRQYHSFTNVFIDRLHAGDITFASEGMKHIEKSVQNKTGGIILMSHVGNWEVAARLLKRGLPETELLLYMGIKNKEQIENLQKDDLAREDIKIIALDRDGGSPFDLVSGVRLLKEGGLVSMTGDILWNKNQRSIPVQFLGHEVFLPEAPHVLALLSGAPLFIFFSFRTGKNRYSFSITEPVFLRADLGSEKKEAVRKSAQKYADILEKTVREHPSHWYHFEQFLGRKI